MPCKCGHQPIDHPSPSEPYSWESPQFPCLKCDCKNYERVTEEAKL